ncbi:hypothetical protein CDAR_245991 [Caerostris darwini]|uniref:Uncharacterized protein n=1 Tax=Caerostris darwini TaxID=1538125 RepID=A0AAV4UWP7_9ARAC|nr:hypothetical protein CDAR_245991 [Caerostris darwini]
MMPFCLFCYEITHLVISMSSPDDGGVVCLLASNTQITRLFPDASKIKHNSEDHMKNATRQRMNGVISFIMYDMIFQFKFLEKKSSIDSIKIFLENKFKANVVP